MLFLLLFAFVSPNANEYGRGHPRLKYVELIPNGNPDPRTGQKAKLKKKIYFNSFKLHFFLMTRKSRKRETFRIGLIIK